MKWLFVLLLLAGNAYAQNRGDCVPITDNNKCSDGQTGVQGLGCPVGMMYCGPIRKCCIIEPGKECKNVIALKQIIDCKDVLTDGFCPPDCSLEITR